MEIEFSGLLDKKLLLKAIKLTGKSSRWQTILRLIVAFILIGLLITVFIPSSDGSSRETITWSRYSRLFFTVPILLYFILQPFINPYIIANKMWKNPATQLPIIGKITTAGIDFLFDQNSSISYKWDDYARIIVQPDQITLLTSKGVLQIFPQSFFHDESDWQRASQLMRSRIKTAI